VVCTGRRTFNSFRNGVKKFNDSIKVKYDDFQPVGEAAETLCGFVKNWQNEGVEASPSKVSLRLPIAETFSRETNGTRGA
jgi:hypothetical protein